MTTQLPTLIKEVEEEVKAMLKRAKLIGAVWKIVGSPVQMVENHLGMDFDLNLKRWRLHGAWAAQAGELCRAVVDLQRLSVSR